MRSLLFMSAALLALTACSPSNNVDITKENVANTATKATMQAQMNKWLEDEFNKSVEHYPEFLATRRIQRAF